MVLAMMYLHPYGKPLAFVWLIVLGMITLFGLVGLRYVMQKKSHR